ncbi:hypothetical protein L6452_34559 [Arctium lappa]|uniref:Uncharacterized protein n=1 Tax=Arctium lappa TaxID=4217 RepID=A0ACB8YJ91_ARCLA|nr:hypothetical protein L6452_34559 [Arctium lappa]
MSNGFLSHCILSLQRQLMKVLLGSNLLEPRIIRMATRPTSSDLEGGSLTRVELSPRVKAMGACNVCHVLGSTPPCMTLGTIV